MCEEILTIYRRYDDAQSKWEAWKEEFKEYEGGYWYSRIKELDFGTTITCSNEGGNIKVHIYDDGSVVYTWSDGGEEEKFKFSTIDEFIADNDCGGGWLTGKGW